MKTKILTILCFIATTIACSKKHEPIPEVTLKTYISKQAFSEGIYTWNYDAQNRLKDIVFVSANESANKSHTYSVTVYDASNRISEGKYDYNDPTVKDIRFKNTFNAVGKLERTQYYDDATGTADSYTTITYSNAQQTIVNGFAKNGTLSYCYVYQLTGDLKNVEQFKSYNGVDGTGTLLSTTTFRNYNSTIKSYSPLYPIGYGPTPIFENVYAVQIYTTAAGVATTYTFTYEANADGYVTKRIAPSGASSTYEYIKK